MKNFKMINVYIYIGINVKYPLFFSDVMKLEFSRQIFEKYSNVNFQENPSGGSRVVPCEQRGTDGQTDMTKLIVIFATVRKRLKTAVYLKSDQFSRLSFSRHHGLQAELMQVWVGTAKPCRHLWQFGGSLLPVFSRIFIFTTALQHKA